MINKIIITYRKNGKEIELAIDKSRILLVEREENKVYVSLDIEGKAHYMDFEDSEKAKKAFELLTDIEWLK